MRKILIIDDEESLVDSISFMLRTELHPHYDAGCDLTDA